MTVVCVLGMHRSGTSCLAGALQSAGLFAGEVVESAPFNPKGNRENLRIRALNDAVLGASGGSWRHPPQELTWTPEHERERNDIVTDFERRADVWTFKDPRTVLTLDFWRAGIADFVLVGTFRHPTAVVGSLQQRALDSNDPQLRIDVQEAIRLWLHYNRIIVDLRRQSVFPLLCFDDPVEAYLDNLRAAIVWIETRLGKLTRCQPDAAAQFFDEKLVRQIPREARSAGGAGPHRELGEAAEELYSELSGMAVQEGCFLDR